MQVDNVSNYKIKRNPQFTSIKSITTSGLYKKFPEYGKELVDAFRKNPEVIQFCKKYDVDIVFDAFKGTSMIESSMHILYDNLAKSKVRRFFDRLCGNRDKVSLHSWGNSFDVKLSIKKSTSDLVEMILPEGAGVQKSRNGLLNSHLRSADKSIQDILDERAQKSLAQKSKKAEKVHAEDCFVANEKALDDSIKDLMNDI